MHFHIECRDQQYINQFAFVIFILDGDSKKLKKLTNGTNFRRWCTFFNLLNLFSLFLPFPLSSQWLPFFQQHDIRSIDVWKTTHKETRKKSIHCNCSLKHSLSKALEYSTASSNWTISISNEQFHSHAWYIQWVVLSTYKVALGVFEIQPGRHNHQPTNQQGTKWTGKACMEA